VELMVGLVVGMLVLLVLSTVFVASSSNFAEAERSSREIENGRYATFILRDEIQHAGFYGEIGNVTGLELTPPIAVPATMPDPCATSVAAVTAALPLAVQGVDAPNATPTCLPDHVAGTDILVIRRSNTTNITAPSAVANGYYTQVSECATQSPVFMLAHSGFNLTLKDCATTANVRQYHINIYYVSPCNVATGTNGACASSDLALPTLKRLELAPGGFSQAVPLVEGIENLQLEYGMDTKSLPDGSPTCYVADPGLDNSAICPAMTPAYNWSSAPANWSNVVALRVHLLARNTTITPGFTDSKSYQLGNLAAGTPNNVTPGGGFKRHVFTAVTRVTNVGQRMEQPI
jgi:type IV pilus assembly protein PilW